MNPRHLLIACVAASLAAPALAQYKIVAPDGSVTYTDRPPVNTTGRVTPVGRSGTATGSAGGDTEAALPIELRQLAARYPVMLYTGANCTPCDSGRQLLQQRGIPYAERRIVTEEDSAALERLSGGRTLPTLTIGQQPLRGLFPSDWTGYLDAAGYPRESRLPRGWQAPAVTPLVSREPAAAPPAPTAAAPVPSPQATAAPAPASGIRF